MCEMSTNISFHSHLMDMSQIIMANSALHASLVIYRLTSNARSWKNCLIFVLLKTGYSPFIPPEKHGKSANVNNKSVIRHLSVDYLSCRF